MFRDSDIEEIRTKKHVQKQKELLYYLYLYHMNYKSEDVKTKRKLRDYYDNELRYRGAFYRDKKKFEEKGNPLEWEEFRVKRYKLKYSEEKAQKSFFNFSSFVYPTSKLVGIELSKQIELMLIETQEDFEFGTFFYNVNFSYETTIRNELEKMKRLINKIDVSSGKVKLKRGYNPIYFENLKDLQVKFKLRFNDQVRYISTRYVTQEFIIDVAINRLESYLRKITKLDKRFDSEGVDTDNYKEFDEDFRLEYVVLERIYILKRSNMFHLQEERTVEGYDLEIYPYQSINIMEIIAT